MPEVDERMADGAHRMALADTLEAEGQHVGRLGRGSKTTYGALVAFVSAYARRREMMAPTLL